MEMNTSTLLEAKEEEARKDEQKKEEKNLIYDVESNPPINIIIIYALQVGFRHSCDHFHWSV